MASLPYYVRRNPRAKRVIVKLLPGTGLQVVLPPEAPESMVSDVLREKRAWIEYSARSMVEQGRPPWPEAHELPSRVDFPGVGLGFEVRRVERAGVVRLRGNAASIMLSGPTGAEDAMFERLRDFVRRTAREHLPPMLRNVADELGLAFDSVTIRSQSRRWGSCSSRGRISLNCKALFLSPELLRHLMIHELCHLRHPNHSKSYWRLVERFQPGYRELESHLSHGMGFVPGWMNDSPSAKVPNGFFSIKRL